MPKRRKFVKSGHATILVKNVRTERDGERERKEEAYECALCRISGLEDHIPAKKKRQMSHKLWWKKVSVNFAVGSSNPSQMKRRIETMKKRQR